MNSYPFTSQVTYDEQGLPLYDRAVDSEFLRQVNRQYYSDGVFYDQSDRLQVVADTGMQVKVMPGCAHIQGAIGIETQQRTLQVQAADEQDRIDAVVVRLDLSLAVRSSDLYILKGAPAESPQPPALTRDSTTWELGLANLFIAQNTATVSQQRITDTRLDTGRCGVVGATAQPPFDTDAYFAQLEAAISAHQKDAKAQILQLQQAIAAVEGNSAWMMRDLYDPQGKGMDVTVQTYTHKHGYAYQYPAGFQAGSGGSNMDVLLYDPIGGQDDGASRGTPVVARRNRAAADQQHFAVLQGKDIRDFRKIPCRKLARKDTFAQAVEPYHHRMPAVLPDSNDVAVAKIRTNLFIVDFLAVRTVVHDRHELCLHPAGGKNRHRHAERPKDILSCFHCIVSFLIDPNSGLLFFPDDNIHAPSFASHLGLFLEREGNRDVLILRDADSRTVLFLFAQRLHECFAGNLQPSFAFGVEGRLGSQFDKCLCYGHGPLFRQAEVVFLSPEFICVPEDRNLLQIVECH